MKIMSVRSGLLAVITVGVFYACKHEIPFPAGTTVVTETPNPGSSGRTCSPDSVYFANEIQPLVNANCSMSGCHDAITHEEGLNLTTYTGILKIVSPGKSSSSKLYKEIVRTDKDRMPPPPMPAMSADQVAKIQRWINQGAVNNVCDKCDTADFKYSTAIKPLIDTKCVGCHNSASLGGGVDLSSYAAVKTSAASGKLLGSVKWTAGISAMPKGAAKMPDCEIVQIQKWIAAGSLNN